MRSSTSSLPLLRLASGVLALVALVAVPTGAWRQGAAGGAADIGKAAQSITGADLFRDAGVLAADLMEGRLTGTPGQGAAAAYVVRSLRQAGVAPFGDDAGYYQHYTVTRSVLRSAESHLSVGSRRFAYGTDFVITSFLRPGPHAGGVVYVGAGIRAPKLKIDPYAGVDVRGKWLLVHPPGVLPAGVTREMLGAAGTDHMLPAQEARARGAVGLLVVPTPAQLKSLDEVKQRPTASRDLDPSRGWAYAQQPLPHVVLSGAALEALLEGERLGARDVLAGTTGREASVALAAAKTVTLAIAADSSGIRPYNVVGFIEGADPALRDEYVTVASHLDGAVGTRAIDGDAIYNAADDNASGSAGNLAVARALMRGPRPRRSIVLIWDTGEETGLWGSRHMAYGPLASKIVAHVNIDMIGRTKQPGTNLPGEEELTGPGEVFVAGPGVLSTRMDAVLARVAKEFKYVSMNRRFDVGTESFFYPRTDAAPYFERGIPFLEFFTGLHGDYHRPSDEPWKLDPAKMEAVTRTAYVTIWLMADDPVRPQIDKPLPPNLAAVLAR